MIKKLILRTLYLLALPLIAACVEMSKPPAQKPDNNSFEFAVAYNKMVSSLRLPSADSGGFDVRRWQTVEHWLMQSESLKMAEQWHWDYVGVRQQRYPIVGYKVALGSYRVQQLFGLSEPVIGVLFEGDLLPNGESVDLLSAKNLAFEPDLLVTVKSAALNAATTVAEVAPHIDRVAAFIELPDLMVPINPAYANAFIATNAAVRSGVVGDSVKASTDDAFIARLGTMKVVSYDQHGVQLSTASGHALMGHPYRAVLFLLEKLKRKNILLQAGDVISLGAYAKPQKAAGYRAVSVEYHGLDPARVLRAKVSFR